MRSLTPLMEVQLQEGNNTEFLKAFEMIKPGLADVLTRTFSFMEVAEEEILAGQARHLTKQKEIWNIFTFLRPYDRPFTEYTPILFRAHCYELIERLVKGEDLRPGTNAEIIIAFVKFSPNHSMNSLANRLYCWLFVQAFASFQDRLKGTAVNYDEIVEMERGLSTYITDDELNYELRRLRRQLFCEERTPIPKQKAMLLEETYAPDSG